METLDGRKIGEEVFRCYIIEELKEKKINISEDDYNENPAFKSLNEEFVMVDGITLTKAWWVEKYIVGQERLRKIYGKYELGIKYEFLENELKESVWFHELADKYPEVCHTEADIYRYFYRNEKSNDGTERMGLIERLKKLGYDIQKFSECSERVKLLYFLYCFEHEKRMELVPFLGKPTLENVDNSLVGDMTRNGALMKEIKRSVAKEIDAQYIVELNRSIVKIGKRWQGNIEKALSMLDASENGNYIKELERIEQQLSIMLMRIEDKQSVKYRDSALETFYLKLVQHESLGRELDIIEALEYAMKDLDCNLAYRPSAYKDLASSFVKENEEGTAILKYIAENRKELAQFVFGEDEISSNMLKKFDLAVGKIKYYFDMLQDNSRFKLNEGIPILVIVVCIQEIVVMDKKRKVPNPFYRHESGDLKTLNAELNFGTSAFRKNQIVWVERVNCRFNFYKGVKEEKLLVQKIQTSIERLLIKIYGCDSLKDMMCVHEYLNTKVYIILVGDKKIESVLKNFSRVIGRRKKGYSFEGDYFVKRRFIALLMPGTILEQLAKRVANWIIQVEKKKEVCRKQWPLELGEGNYYRDLEVRMLVNTDDKTIKLEWFEYVYNQRNRELLQHYGIVAE